VLQLPVQGQPRPAEQADSEATQQQELPLA
jgi:hypothetical protein